MFTRRNYKPRIFYVLKNVTLAHPNIISTFLGKATSQHRDIFKPETCENINPAFWGVMHILNRNRFIPSGKKHEEADTECPTFI